MVNIKMSDSILHLTVLSKRSPFIFTDEEKRSHLRKETQGAMVCDTTHLCVLHDSFMCVTQHIHTCQLSSCRTGYNLCMPMPTYIHVCVSHVCHNVCMMPTCIHVCECMRTPTYTEVCVSRTCMWASPCIHVCMQKPSYMCVYIHVDVHTCSYLRMYAHAYTRVRACAYISIKHKTHHPQRECCHYWLDLSFASQGAFSNYLQAPRRASYHHSLPHHAQSKKNELNVFVFVCV